MFQYILVPSIKLTLYCEVDGGGGGGRDPVPGGARVGTGVERRHGGQPETGPAGRRRFEGGAVAGPGEEGRRVAGGVAV